MLTHRYLDIDNRIHEDSAAFGNTIGHEFDYDDPDMMDLFADEEPWANTEDIIFVRDFILNSSLYIFDLEAALGSAYASEQHEFWEAREHAYQIVSKLLVDLLHCE